MHSTIKHKLLNTLYFCIGILLIGVVLQLLSLAKNNSFIFPNFIDIVKAFFRLLGEGNTYKYIARTVLDLVIALLASSIIGIGLGVLMGLRNEVRIILKPFMVMLRSIPMIVLIIIIMILSDFSYVPAISASLVIIPMFSDATYEGIKKLDKGLMDVYKLQSNFNIKVLWKVHLPLISGYIRQAFVNGLSMGLKIVITAEYIVGVKETLGKAVYNARTVNMNYVDLYAYAFIMMFLVIILEYVPVLIAYTARKINESKQKKINIEEIVKSNEGKE